MMSPVKSRAGGRTAGMRPVSRNPSHFRSCRRLLIAQGTLLVALGSAGFIADAIHPNASPVGAHVLMLTMTPWHSALLVGFGVLAVIGALNRRAAIAVTGIGAVVFLVLVIVGAVSATHQAPGPLGLQPRDILLYAVLFALNFAALYWLLPDALEGPDWVRRRGTRRPAAARTPPAAAMADDVAGPAPTAAGAEHTQLATPTRPTETPTAEPTQQPSPAHPIGKRSVMNSAQNVVITGASAGVGRAAARAFGGRGDNVALLARGQGGLDGAVKDVEAVGGHALAIPTDVADYQQVVSAADLAQKTFGPIDVWVNVAFTSVFAPFHEIAADEYRRVTEVSYLGYVHATMVALQRMRPRNHGTIVQVGSALGSRAIPLQSAYCGAKHAINGFTESVRTELMHEHSDVHITIVQMPALNTPQFSWVLSRLPKHPQPVPPIYQPEIAARAVLFAAEHPGRKQYWVGASTAATILGQRFVPALLDRYLARTGYASQQTGQPVSLNRPNNLWEPVDDDAGNDHGAHGTFDNRSIGVSPQLWASQHARVSTLVAAGAAAAITLTRVRRG